MVILGGWVFLMSEVPLYAPENGPASDGTEASPILSPIQKRPKCEGGSGGVSVRSVRRYPGTNASPRGAVPNFIASFGVRRSSQVQRAFSVPLSSEYGTYKTVKARFWLWPSAKVLRTF